MSLIVRQRWDGRVVLYCKGADSVVLKLLEEGGGQAAELQAVEAHLVGTGGQEVGGWA